MAVVFTIGHQFLRSQLVTSKKQTSDDNKERATRISRNERF
jgi:hypothetical protein